MIDIKKALAAFIQVRLEFNGLLQVVDPAQAPELVDRINAFYREDRLPTQPHGAHLSQEGQGKPANLADTLLPAQQVPPGIPGPENVNVALQNAWGLFDSIGDVLERVKADNSFGIMGGHCNGPSKECTIKTSRSYNGKVNSLTGSRLLKEIRC
jgi:hypothetical protein